MKKQSSKSRGKDAKTAKVVEFYVPGGFVKSRRWVPERLRGQIIEFPAPLKKPA